MTNKSSIMLVIVATILSTIFLMLIILAPFTFGVSLTGLPVIGAIALFLANNVLLTIVGITCTGLGSAFLIGFLFKKFRTRKPINPILQKVPVLVEKEKMTTEDIQEFDFSMCNDEDIERILNKATHLECLNLSGKRLDSSSFWLTAKTLSKFSHITCLDLSNTQLGDDEVEKLCALLSMPNLFLKLEKLDLSHNRISSLGYIHISRVLNKISYDGSFLRYLHTILLKDNYISYHLEELPLKEDRGIYMNLSGNGITSRFEEDTAILVSENIPTLDLSPTKHHELAKIEEELEKKEDKVKKLPLGRCFFYSRPLEHYKSWIPVACGSQTPDEKRWETVIIDEQKKYKFRFKPDECLIYVSCPNGLWREHFAIYLEWINAKGQQCVKCYELLGPFGFLKTSEGRIASSSCSSRDLLKNQPSYYDDIIFTFALAAVVDQQTGEQMRKALSDVTERVTRTIPEGKTKKTPTITFIPPIKKPPKYYFFSSVLGGNRSKNTENCLTWAVKFLEEHGVKLPDSDSTLPSNVVKSTLRRSFTKELPIIVKPEKNKDKLLQKKEPEELELTQQLTS